MVFKEQVLVGFSCRPYWKCAGKQCRRGIGSLASYSKQMEWNKQLRTTCLGNQTGIQILSLHVSGCVTLGWSTRLSVGITSFVGCSVRRKRGRAGERWSRANISCVLTTALSPISKEGLSPCMDSGILRSFLAWIAYAVNVSQALRACLHCMWLQSSLSAVLIPEFLILFLSTRILTYFHMTRILGAFLKSVQFVTLRF